VAERTVNVAAPASRRRDQSSTLRGTLIVTSSPRGASVFINNDFAGRTPLTLQAIPAGSRAVRVRLDGYSTWSRGVSIVANRSTTVAAELTRDKTSD
jgi:hypothetical protein